MITQFSHFQILLIYILVNHSNGSNVSRYGSNVSRHGSNVTKYEDSNVSKYDDNDSVPECGDCNYGEECVDGKCIKIEGEAISTLSTTVTPPDDHSTPTPTSVPSTVMPPDEGMQNKTTSSTEPIADDNKMKLAIYGGAGGACVIVIIVVLYFLYKRFRGPRKGGRFPEFETPLEALRCTGTIRDVESFPKLPPAPIPRPRPQPRPRQTLKRPSYENDENIYVDPDDLNRNHYVRS